jgi:predicted nucleic acid-binding protein
VRRPRKFALDSQLFINGFRDERARSELNRFHQGCAPFEYLSVIVAHELRAGIRSDQDRQALERNVLNLYERTGRSFAPSPGVWHRSGDVLAQMSRQEGLQLSRISKSFSNDILLALSCREHGCVLVTDNERDFRRIQRYVEFEFVKPWPGVPS